MIDAPLTVKQQAVNEYMKGRSAVMLGRRFGYGPLTILQWVREWQRGGFNAAAPDPEVTPQKMVVTAERAAAVTVAARQVYPNARVVAIPEEREPGLLDNALIAHTAALYRMHAELGLPPPVLP